MTSVFKPGWEAVDPPPFVMAAVAELARRDDVFVARLSLFDVEDVTRTVDLDERVAWDLHRTLGEILERLHRPR